MWEHLPPHNPPSLRQHLFQVGLPSLCCAGRVWIATWTERGRSSVVQAAPPGAALYLWALYVQHLPIAGLLDHVSEHQGIVLVCDHKTDVLARL